MWSDAAKALTLQAAEAVGLGTRDTLRLISEPEAAAVYSLKTIQPNKLKVASLYPFPCLEESKVSHAYISVDQGHFRSSGLWGRNGGRLKSPNLLEHQ